MGRLGNTGSEGGKRTGERNAGHLALLQATVALGSPVLVYVDDLAVAGLERRGPPTQGLVFLAIKPIFVLQFAPSRGWGGW